MLCWGTKYDDDNDDRSWEWSQMWILLSFWSRRILQASKWKFFAKVITQTAFFVHGRLKPKIMAIYFGPWGETLRTIGWDSSALRSEMSFGHFGTSEVSGQFRPATPVPKCLGSEMSRIQSVWFPSDANMFCWNFAAVVHSHEFHGSYLHKADLRPRCHTAIRPTVNGVRLTCWCSLTGMSGMVVLDNNGDREPDYWISDMDPTTGIFIKIAEVLNTDGGERVLCCIWSLRKLHKSRLTLWYVCKRADNCIWRDYLQSLMIVTTDWPKGRYTTPIDGPWTVNLARKIGVYRT